MSFHMIISCRCDLHFVLQILNSMNTNNQPSGHNFFPYNPFDWIFNLSKFVNGVSFDQMYPIKIVKCICNHYLSIKILKSFALLNAFLFIPEKKTYNQNDEYNYFKWLKWTFICVKYFIK